MPFLETFVYDKTKSRIDEIGTESVELIDLNTLIATRPFLNATRLDRPRRRGSVDIPHVVFVADQRYVVDGHHKTKRAIDQGMSELPCRVLQTDNQRLAEALSRMDQGIISSLPIREFPFTTGSHNLELIEASDL